MIGGKSQIIMLLAVVCYFVLLILLLRKKMLNLKYGLLWIFSGVLMLILAIFPGILNSFSRLVGIASPTNALFAVILFCVMIILMSLTAIVSGLNNKVKRLAQAIALLENRLRAVETAEKREKVAEK